MAREGLILPLRAAINQAKKENKTVRRENVRVESNGKTVNVEVIPLARRRKNSSTFWRRTSGGRSATSGTTSFSPTPRDPRPTSEGSAPKSSPPCASRNTRCAAQAAAAARDYAENTVETVREPLLVLIKNCASKAPIAPSYRAFRVAPSDTICWFMYDLGNRQWDIPRLRELLGEVLAESTSIDDFQVEHDFEQLGRHTMLLNARCIHDPQRKGERILLGIEDVTERREAEEAVRESRFLMIDALPAAIYTTDPKGPPHALQPRRRGGLGPDAGTRDGPVMRGLEAVPS